MKMRSFSSVNTDLTKMRDTAAQAFTIGRISYVGWLTNPRMLLVPVLWIFLYEFCLRAMFKYAAMMSTPLNVLEPFIATTNSSLVVPMVIIGFLLLISDCPKIGSGELLVLYRIGRMRWLLGQMLFFFCAAVTYMVQLFCFCFLSSLRVSFLANGWSEYVKYIRHQDFYHILVAESQGSLIEQNLYLHSRPYGAAARSFLLILLYLLVISGIILLFNILQKKTVGVLISIAVVILGFVLWGSPSRAMWLLPMANSIFGWHNKSLLPQENCSMAYSYSYFAVVISGLAAASVLFMKRCDIHASVNQS